MMKGTKAGMGRDNEQVIMADRTEGKSSNTTRVGVGKRHGWLPSSCSPGHTEKWPRLSSNDRKSVSTLLPQTMH